MSDILERWYKFGNVDNKLLIGIVTGLGSLFLLYLAINPKKVR